MSDTKDADLAGQVAEIIDREDGEDYDGYRSDKLEAADEIIAKVCTEYKQKVKELFKDDENSYMYTTEQVRKRIEGMK